MSPIQPDTMIKFEYVNATEGYRYGHDWLAAKDAMGGQDTGTLYRSLQRIYGRCTGRVYVDYVDARGHTSVACGWVFQKRALYDDTRKPYTRETWITLHEYGERIMDGPVISIGPARH